mgnify:CR=1 FL=1
MFNFTVSIAFEENDCLLNVGLFTSSKFEITLDTSPADNFADTLGAILLALKVLEKIIKLASCECSFITSATDLQSLFEIFG